MSSSPRSSVSSDSTFTFNRRRSQERTKRMQHDEVRQMKIKAIARHNQQNPLKQLWRRLIGKLRGGKASFEPPFPQHLNSAVREASRQHGPMRRNPRDRFASPGACCRRESYDRGKRRTVFGERDITNHTQGLDSTPRHRTGARNYNRR